MEVVANESMALGNGELYICMIMKLEPDSVALEIGVVAFHPGFSFYVVFLVSHLNDCAIQSPLRDIVVLEKHVLWD